MEGNQEGRRLPSAAKPAASRQGGRHSVRAPLEPACSGDVNGAVTKQGLDPSGSRERQDSNSGCDAAPAGSAAGGTAAGGAEETLPDEQPEQPEQPAPEKAGPAQAVHPPPLRQQPQPAAGGAQPQLPFAAAEPAKQQPKRRRRRLGANRALAASPEPEDDYGPQRRPRG